MVDISLIWLGGLSFLSSQYGWAANNVVNFEVVLANGTVVNANAKENTGKQSRIHDSPGKKTDMGIDLFAALKGGGNNFGIVTAYTLQTHPQDHKVNRVQLYSFGVSKKHRYGEETISLQPIRRLKS